MHLLARPLWLAGVLAALTLAPCADLGAQRGSTRSGDDRRAAARLATDSGAAVWSAITVAGGPLHTDAAGFGVALTGSYVLSTRHLALSLSPLDLGIGFGADNGFHQDRLGVPGSDRCYDNNNVEVSRFRCNASVRYGASAQVVAVLSADPEHPLGLGIGYRAFDSPSAYGVASIELGVVRDARVHLRARAGSRFYDFAVGATFRFPHEPEVPPSAP